MVIEDQTKARLFRGVRIHDVQHPNPHHRLVDVIFSKYRQQKDIRILSQYSKSNN